jgi:DNA polymerase III alpha subunit
MHNDIYGVQILTEEDLCDSYLRNIDITLKNVIVDKSIMFSDVLDLNNIPNLIVYNEPSLTVEDFDVKAQDNWYMPVEYKDMDIAKYVLEQCNKDFELQRVAEELLLYQDKNLFPLLCYCKYLVDTMRKHNIVWGVGRGSSVSSYVLFLIGIHKIDSIFYDLSIDEFLR